jgi:Sec-independent protein translocase protein TatA
VRISLVEPWSAAVRVVESSAAGVVRRCEREQEQEQEQEREREREQEQEQEQEQEHEQEQETDRAGCSRELARS